MKYYKHNETGDVYAYAQSDIDTVNSIASIENTLAKAQDVLSSLPEPPEFVPEFDEEGNQTNEDAHKTEREEYERAKQAVADAEEALAGIDEVFYKIRDNLEHCTLMTAEEVEEHINPTPTLEQLEAAARAKRDGLLRELDAIVSNPLRWAEFDDATKQALAEYRQALLDYPQQEGFPENAVLPDKPDFIKQEGILSKAGSKRELEVLHGFF